jgi:hypothetical protein
MAKGGLPCVLGLLTFVRGKGQDGAGKFVYNNSQNNYGRKT